MNIRLLLLVVSITNVCHCYNRLINDNLEETKWNDVLNELKDEKISLKVFYHVSKWQRHWKEVIQEHISIISGQRTYYTINGNYIYGDNVTTINKDIGSGGYYWNKDKKFVSVLDYANEMLVNVGGSSINDIIDIKNAINDMNFTLSNTHLNKIKFNFNYTLHRDTYKLLSLPKQQKLLNQNISYTEGEVSTIDKLHKYCVNENNNNRKAFVLYFHNKGGCCLRRGETSEYTHAVSSWRETMNTFILEYPSICARSLLKGYSACGYNSQDGSFSGNFYWANCNHVAMLPSILHSPFDAWAAEFFIFNVSSDTSVRDFYSNHCGYSPYNCKKDHYAEECPKYNQTRKLLEFLLNNELPDNANHISITTNNESENMLKRKWNVTYCKVFRNQRYEESIFFNSPSNFSSIVNSFYSGQDYYNKWHALSSITIRDKQYSYDFYIIIGVILILLRCAKDTVFSHKKAF